MSTEIAHKYDIEEIVDALTLLSTNDIADQILRLEAALITGERVECPLEHQFTPGLYIREILVPAGTLFTTYVHKTEHPYYGMVGELFIWEEDKGWEYVKAPCRGTTMPGTKRIVYAITDVIWVTSHANADNITDIETLESTLFEKYSNPYLSLKELQSIKGGLNCQV